MYQPTARQLPQLAFLWPAFAAAAASEMAAAAAKRFADLAVGPDGPAAREPNWATAHTIALELKTVRLRDFSIEAKGSPTSHARRWPCMARLSPILRLVTAWSRHAAAGWAAAALRGRLAHGKPLTCASSGSTSILPTLTFVDEIGGPVDLVGLCQGGWMALLYAARFPAKVRKLVLAGAPVDITAAPSALSRLADASPLAVFRELVRLGDGVLPGRKVQKFWGTESIAAEDARRVAADGGADRFRSLQSARSAVPRLVCVDGRPAGNVFRRSRREALQK